MVKKISPLLGVIGTVLMWLTFIVVWVGTHIGLTIIGLRPDLVIPHALFNLGGASIFALGAYLRWASQQ